MPISRNLSSKMKWSTELNALAKSINITAQYSLMSEAAIMSFRTLNVAEKPDCTGFRTLLDSVEELLIDQTLKYFREAGQD